MKRPDETGFENRELAIDELDGVAAAGLFGLDQVFCCEMDRLGIRRGRERRHLGAGQQPRQHHHSPAELSERSIQSETSGPCPGGLRY
ncbi:hypothetical protein [Bradyrhizobium sp. WSM3983]|uniref:hypothetical protein n=1 Tax=Bradyrhizobium sp. WSM3983 TaxID=1038867 RepID=UPI0012EC800B|nr:hypothetical protein [Bradyrhizobium sp. WSM3983]